jgi:serine/threonine protein kinase
MKILSKTHIAREKKIENVKVERNVMTLCGHPNVIKLALTFQDRSNLYSLIEFARNGDIQKVINKGGALCIESAWVASGQILLGMAQMHQKHILH